MTGRFRFWGINQLPHQTVQDWELKVNDGNIRTELLELKTHSKSGNTKKLMSNLVNEAKALESAQKANRVINETTTGIEEQVH